jgi:DNA-binding response OmpR family regulator
MLGVLRQTPGSPSIVVTGEAHSAIAFLEGGADAYIVSPFSVRVLKAQLRALERRRTTCVAATVTVGDLHLDLAGRTALMEAIPLELSAIEFDLLAALAFHADRFVSREKLLAMVWHRPRGRADKSLQFHLGRLRSKLGETASSPRYLHATRGLGIKLVDPATARLRQPRATCRRASTVPEARKDEVLVAAYG